MAPLIVANHSAYPFTGWVRTTCDGFAAIASSESASAKLRPGKWHSREIRDLDVFVSIDAGGFEEFAPSLGEPPKGPLLTPDVAGGWPTIDGVSMTPHSIEANGAAIEAEFRCLVGRVAYVLMLRHYPGEPWATGSLWANFSDRSPHLSTAFGVGEITFGSAEVHGLSPAPVQVLDDGQGLVWLNLTFFWPSLLESVEQYRSMLAVRDRVICGRGVGQLWFTGNHVDERSPREIITAAYRDRREARWAMQNDYAMPLGPAPASRTTGRQANQFWHCASGAMVVPGPEQVSLLCATYMHARRPANYMDQNGGPLSLNEPGLTIWDGRVDFRTSQDRMGKPGGLPDGMGRGGYFGPDSQHFLAQELLASARLTGHPLAMRLLRNLAVIYKHSRTVEPGRATSGRFSSRETFYEAMFVLEMERTHPDGGELAAHLRERLPVVLAAIGDDEHGYAFTDDPRLGAGRWSILWQDALEALALVLMGERFGHEGAKAVGLRMAKRVLQVGYVGPGDTPVPTGAILIDGVDPIQLGELGERTDTPTAIETDGDPEPIQGWFSRAQAPLDGQSPLPVPDQSFNAFGLPCAVAAVLRLEPGNERARAIWAYLEQQGDRRWMLPGVSA